MGTERKLGARVVALYHLRHVGYASLFSGLNDVERALYKYRVKVDDLLSRFFPEPAGAQAFWNTVVSDIGANRLEIDASWGEGLSFAFPVVIISGVKR